MVRQNPGSPPNTLRAPFPALSQIRRPLSLSPEPLKTSHIARPAAPGFKTPENPQGRLIPPVLRPGPAILKLNSDAASGKRDPGCQRPSPKGPSPRPSSRRDWTRPNPPRRKRPERPPSSYRIREPGQAPPKLTSPAGRLRSRLLQPGRPRSLPPSQPQHGPNRLPPSRDSRRAPASNHPRTRSLKTRPSVWPATSGEKRRRTAELTRFGFVCLWRMPVGSCRGTPRYE